MLQCVHFGDHASSPQTSEHFSEQTRTQRTSLERKGGAFTFKAFSIKHQICLNRQAMVRQKGWKKWERLNHRERRSMDEKRPGENRMDIQTIKRFHIEHDQLDANRWTMEGLYLSSVEVQEYFWWFEFSPMVSSWNMQSKSANSRLLKDEQRTPKHIISIVSWDVKIIYVQQLVWTSCLYCPRGCSFHNELGGA